MPTCFAAALLMPPLIPALPMELIDGMDHVGFAGDLKSNI